MIYVVAFSLSVFSCCIGEQIINTHTRKSYFAHFFFLISVLILIVLAGCRDYTIGTDVLNYGNHVFDLSRQSSSLIELLTKYGILLSDEKVSYEILYLVINYIVSRFTDSAHWLYAVIACIIYSNFFIGIYKYKKHLSVTLAWTFFILLFFAQSLNLMRQMLAMSVMFLGSSHILKKDYIRYIPYAIIAFCFHQTSIIVSIAFVVIRIILMGKNNGLSKFLVVCGAISLFFLYGVFLQFFVNIGMLTERMTQYIYENEIVFSLYPFIQRVLPFAIFVFFAKDSTKSDDTRDYFMMLILMDLILVQMRNFGLGMGRISLYISVFNIYSYAALSERISNANNRVIVKVFLVAFLFAIWIYQVVYMGGSEIYPYTSELLGIR